MRSVDGAAQRQLPAVDQAGGKKGRQGLRECFARGQRDGADQPFRMDVITCPNNSRLNSMPTSKNSKKKKKKSPGFYELPG